MIFEDPTEGQDYVVSFSQDLEGLFAYLFELVELFALNLDVTDLLLFAHYDPFIHAPWRKDKVQEDEDGYYDRRYGHGLVEDQEYSLDGSVHLESFVEIYLFCQISLPLRKEKAGAFEGPSLLCQ